MSKSLFFIYVHKTMRIIPGKIEKNASVLPFIYSIIITIHPFITISLYQSTSIVRFIVIIGVNKGQCFMSQENFIFIKISHQYNLNYVKRILCTVRDFLFAGLYSFGNRAYQKNYVFPTYLFICIFIDFLPCSVFTSM